MPPRLDRAVVQASNSDRYGPKVSHDGDHTGTASRKSRPLTSGIRDVSIEWGSSRSHGDGNDPVDGKAGECRNRCFALDPAHWHLGMTAHAFAIPSHPEPSSCYSQYASEKRERPIFDLADFALSSALNAVMHWSMSIRSVFCCFSSPAKAYCLQPVTLMLSLVIGFVPNSDSSAEFPDFRTVVFGVLSR